MQRVRYELGDGTAHVHVGLFESIVFAQMAKRGVRTDWGAEMTKAQAAALQTKWNQQGNPQPPCEHPIQELAHLIRTDDDKITGTNHCRECGEEIVRTSKPPPLISPPLID